MSAQPQIARKYLHLAIEDASRCLADLAMILQQDEVQWDQARLGGIALGFERAAAHVRGKMLTPKVDEAHKDDGGTMVRDKTAPKDDAALAAMLEAEPEPTAIVIEEYEAPVSGDDLV